ncbi:hypothetical protein ACFVJH_36095 [Streptomyces decoyicus]
MNGSLPSLSPAGWGAIAPCLQMERVQRRGAEAEIREQEQGAAAC